MHPEQDPIDDLFRNRLGNQEVPPPPGLWEEVQAGVQVDKVFKDKLNPFTLQPPASVWKQIYKNLHPNLRPVFLQPTFLRYASAAILIMTVGMWFWTDNEEVIGLKSSNIRPLSLAFKSVTPESRSTAIPDFQTDVRPQWEESAQNFVRQTIVAHSSPLNEAGIQTMDNPIQTKQNSLAQISESPKETFTNPGPETAPLPSIRQLLREQPISTAATNPMAQAYPSTPALSKTSHPAADAWMLSSVFSPDINFSSPRNISSGLDRQQNNSLQYTAGVRVGYALNERWTIQSGVQYADQGTVLIPRGEQDNYTGTSSFSRMGTPMEVKAQIIDIPVVVRYRLLGDTWRWFISSGMNANVTGGTSSVLIGTGTELKAGKKLSVSIEPAFRRSIESLPNYKPNTLSIFTGIHYRLN